MKSVVLSMSRGNVVLDENLRNLKTYLQGKNIRVFEAPDKMSDELAAIFSSGRILITNNTKDFKQAAIEHEFGIIATENCNTQDAPALSNRISKAITEYSLWSQTKPFIFYLSNFKLEVLSE